VSDGNGASPSLNPARSTPVVASRTPTVDWEHVIVARHVPDDDPTETYHEASRLYPGVVDPFVRGAPLLERSGELRATVTRSVKRHAHLPWIGLPKPRLGEISLASAVARRRSGRTYGRGPLRLGDLATVLGIAYGVTGAFAGTTQLLRAVPSGGALYPLELYVAAGDVAGLDQGLYHYDPLRHVLERLRPLEFQPVLGSLSPDPELLNTSAAVVLVSAMFWRSRFKYGQRAYRFTLLEAGHAVQNALLACAALDLTAVPVGGFFDRRADELLACDGLSEATLYLLAVGRPHDGDP
jgi:SagB-type dehydrogenase family enzyme